MPMYDYQCEDCGRKKLERKLGKDMVQKNAPQLYNNNND